MRNKEKITNVTKFILKITPSLKINLVRKFLALKHVNEFQLIDQILMLGRVETFSEKCQQSDLRYGF